MTNAIQQTIPTRSRVNQPSENGSGENQEKRRREHKKVEYVGSRWAGVVLLLLTALLSLTFSFQGKGMTFQIGNVLDRVNAFFFGSSTMTFEK